jgi:chemotaxis protein MotB
MATKSLRPIIVIKKNVKHGAHHGGAWKVAYADFVTAMMSLFIVLWLLNTSPQIKKAVAGYFNDPMSSGRQTGTLSLGSGESVSIDKQNVEKLKQEIEKAILRQADLTKLSKQVDITVTGEGLKIDLIEDKGGTFFETGSATLSENGVALLNLLAAQLKVLPNHLLIEGHTDAQPYSSDTGYTNWELSTDRANSARRLLQQDAVGPSQISQVRGYADQKLRVPSNPLDPSNRRISLIVQWADASQPPPVKPLPLDTSAATAQPTAIGPTEKPAASAPDPPSSAAATVSASQPTAVSTIPKFQPSPRTATAHPWLARLRNFIPGNNR